MKPVHLPLDDPGLFNYFFDSSARRTCYLAPERFYPPTAKPADESGMTEPMDVFSVGCVLAEMFCDGVPPFSLSQLFSYRKGEYKTELQTYLKQIEDADVMAMIQSMLSLDPEARQSAAHHLSNPLFPAYFFDLHEFVFHLNSTSNEPLPLAKASTQAKLTGPINAAILSDPLVRPEPFQRTDADERVDRIVQDWESLLVHFPRPDPTYQFEKTLSIDSTYFPLQLGAIPDFDMTMPEFRQRLHPKVDSELCVDGLQPG